MSLRVPILVFSVVLLVSEARVTFPYSEVLQANDLVNNEASFNCDKGCKVYVDRRDDFLQITQNGKLIANFNDIVGNNPLVPAGIELPAGTNFKLQSNAAQNADFVFYAVSVTAPNNYVSVAAPQDTPQGSIAFNGQGRYGTVLSSFNAIKFSAIKGSFIPTFPRIYATGADGVANMSCVSVYQARSQYNAEQSEVVIFAPIVTIDFGYEGKHEAIATPVDGKDLPKTPVGTTIYMSPGYVGCSNVAGLYQSNVKSIEDSFSITADLDIDLAYKHIAPTEPLRFTLQGEETVFVGSSLYMQRYVPNEFTISVSWTRQTEQSSWSMQLDFGTDTVPPTTPAPSSLPTTSSARATLTTLSLASLIVFSLR